MADVEALLKRFDRIKQRSNWETEWQSVAEYVLPRKSDITVTRTKGSKRTEKLFDATAIHANELLAASLQGTMTNTATQWFRLSLRDQSLLEIKEVQDWLEVCGERMYAEFNTSNFNSEVHEMYLDLCSVGTGCLLVEEKETKQATFNGFLFKALQISEYYIDEDYEGRVNTVFRRFKYTPRQCVERWGDKAGKDIKDLMGMPNRADEEIDLLHIVIPTTGKNPELPYDSIYIYPEKKYLISEGGYRDFPYMVPRWTKASGEKYGRSPASTSMPDIRTLNKAVELELKAWAKDIDPPMIVPDEGISANFSITPAKLNYVRPDLVDKIKPIESGHRYDVSQIKLEELRGSVRRMFFSDQLQFSSAPSMTATEVQVRYELMQRLLGPTLGRLETEFLNRLIERSFSMMFRAGAFPEPPKQIQGLDIDIQYTGPLTRSQRLSEVAAFRNFIETISPLASMQPEIMDLIDSDEVITGIAKFVGIPVAFLRDDKIVKQIREARAQAQQEEIQKQDAERLTDGMSKVANIQ